MYGSGRVSGYTCWPIYDEKLSIFESILHSLFSIKLTCEGLVFLRCSTSTEMLYSNGFKVIYKHYVT